MVKQPSVVVLVVIVVEVAVAVSVELVVVAVAVAIELAVVPQDKEHSVSADANCCNMHRNGMWCGRCNSASMVFVLVLYSY